MKTLSGDAAPSFKEKPGTADTRILLWFAVLLLASGGYAWWDLYRWEMQGALVG